MRVVSLLWILIQLTQLGWSLTPAVGYYGGITVDPVSGELIKPAGMSDQRFKVLRALRLKDRLREGTQEALHRRSSGGGRQRREVQETPNAVGTVLQGFYKQESLILDKFNQFSVNTIPLPQVADLIRIDDYTTRTSSDKIGFFVRENTTGGWHEVAVQTLKDGSWHNVAAAVGSSSLQQLLDLQANPKARVTDLVLFRHPRGAMNFLVVTIDYEVEYPRNDGHPLDINEPVPTPVAGQSSLFRFEFDSEALTYTVSREKYLKTVRAMDAEVWYYDDKAFVGIAQIGDVSTDVPYTQSAIYVQVRPDIVDFNLLQGTLEDQDLITQGATSLRHFEMNSRSCVVFANSEPRNLSAPTTSPVYTYNYETERYELMQDLPTFGAVDIEFLAIPDPYPLHSQFFLIAGNRKDSGLDAGAESIIFKYVSGQFCPFQALAIPGLLAVRAYSRPVITPAVVGNALQERHLQHLVVFLEETSDLAVYQFDGVKFVELEDHAVVHPATDLELVDLSSDSSAPTLLVQSISGTEMLTLNFHSATAHEFSTTAASRLRYCLEQKQEQLNARNFKRLHSVYEDAPKLSKLSEGTLSGCTACTRMRPN